MKAKGLFLIILSIALLAPGIAMADNFHWTFAAPNLSGSGILSANATATPGLYDITGGTGKVNYLGTTFTVSFVPCPNFPNTCTFVNSDGQGANLEFDNYLYPANTPGQQLDYYGITLQPGPAGTNALGIWDTPSQEFFRWGPDGYQNLTTPFTVTATPEPGSIGLLIPAGLALLGAVRRKNLGTK